MGERNRITSWPTNYVRSLELSHMVTSPMTYERGVCFVNRWQLQCEFTSINPIRSWGNCGGAGERAGGAARPRNALGRAGRESCGKDSFERGLRREGGPKISTDLNQRSVAPLSLPFHKETSHNSIMLSHGRPVLQRSHSIHTKHINDAKNTFRLQQNDGSGQTLLNQSSCYIFGIVLVVM